MCVVFIVWRFSSLYFNSHYSQSLFVLKIITEKLFSYNLLDLFSSYQYIEVVLMDHSDPKCYQEPKPIILEG